MEGTVSALAIDIRLIVEPHTQTAPELKTDRLYTNMSAAEVRDALLEMEYTVDEVPSERALRDILNRMNDRLKRIQKGKPPAFAGFCGAAAPQMNPSGSSS